MRSISSQLNIVLGQIRCPESISNWATDSTNISPTPGVAGVTAQQVAVARVYLAVSSEGTDLNSVPSEVLGEVNRNRFVAKLMLLSSALASELWNEALEIAVSAVECHTQWKSESEQQFLIDALATCFLARETLTSAFCDRVFGAIGQLAEGQRMISLLEMARTVTEGTNDFGGLENARNRSLLTASTSEHEFEASIAMAIVRGHLRWQRGDQFSREWGIWYMEVFLGRVPMVNGPLVTGQLFDCCKDYGIKLKWLRQQKLLFDFATALQELFTLPEFELLAELFQLGDESPIETEFIPAVDSFDRSPAESLLDNIEQQMKTGVALSFVGITDRSKASDQYDCEPGLCVMDHFTLALAVDGREVSLECMCAESDKMIIRISHPTRPKYALLTIKQEGSKFQFQLFPGVLLSLGNFELEKTELFSFSGFSELAYLDRIWDELKKIAESARPAARRSGF